MATYNKKINDRYRDYFNTYLKKLSDEFRKMVNKLIFSNPSPIKQIHEIGNYNFEIFNQTRITQFFPNPKIEIVKVHNGMNLYLKNDEEQNLRIEFWQLENFPNIFMMGYFEFDGYITACPYDFFPGDNLEYIDECMIMFRKIMDIWLKEVIGKFNENLGIEAVFVLD